MKITYEEWANLVPVKIDIPQDLIMQFSDKEKPEWVWDDRLVRELLSEEPQFYVTQSNLHNIENYIGQEIASIEEVEYVFCVVEEDFLDIRTVINHLDRKVREKIYGVELRLLRQFRDLSFDFHVIIRENRDVNEIVPASAKRIFHKEGA